MIQTSLLWQFGISDRALRANLEGITDDEARRRLPSGSNPVNWVLGHALRTRDRLLVLLGAEPALGTEWDSAYGRGSDPAKPDWKPLPLEELKARWEDSQTRGMKALAAATNDEFARPVPKLFTPGEDEPAALQMATLAFHEAYHIGQIGQARRWLGHAPAIR